MKIQTIMNIEVSSICDNTCQYCPAPVQAKHRKTGFMTMFDFVLAIEHVKKLAQDGTQTELNLFGVGEPTLNKNLVAMVKHARKNLPKRIPLHLNTNGNTMTMELAGELKEAGISSIDITGHKAYSAAKTKRIFEAHQIPHRVSFDAVLNPNTWAEQVDWIPPNYPNTYPCPWINKGQVMVMSNGDITRCCIDAFGKGVIGNIYNDFENLEVTPFSLCEKCHHTL